MLLYEAKKITVVDQIRHYTDLSRPLSRELYKHHANGTEIPEFVDVHHIPTLDKIVSKKLPKNITLYSGIRHDPRTTMSGDDTMHIPAYMSTSTKYGIAQKFADRQAARKDVFDTHGVSKAESAHILEINAKKGQFASNISKKSLERDESEYLLPRNTILKLSDKPEILHGSDRDTYVWSCIIFKQ
jgi:hypothetical protein